MDEDGESHFSRNRPNARRGSEVSATVQNLENRRPTAAVGPRGCLIYPPPCDLLKGAEFLIEQDADVVVEFFWPKCYGTGRLPVVEGNTEQSPC